MSGLMTPYLRDTGQMKMMRTNAQSAVMTLVRPVRAFVINPNYKDTPNDRSD